MFLSIHFLFHHNLKKKKYFIGKIRKGYISYNRLLAEEKDATVLSTYKNWQANQ